MLKQIILSCFIFFVLPIEAFSWSGGVLTVIEGDIVEVMGSHNKKETIRLYGIDSPEKKQPYGHKAKEFSASIIEGDIVEVEEISEDKNGRTAAIVSTEEKVLNEELVKWGYAWVYKHDCKKSVCSEWVQLEASARKAKIGLWTDLSPVPPWKWQKQKKPTMNKDMISIVGKMEFIGVEGGFWGIVGDDGRKYDPLGLPPEFKVKGVSIEAKVIPQKGMMSFRMWGTIVKIVEIKRIE